MFSSFSTPSSSPTPKIRIGMILDQPFPPDSRVEREALALIQQGYEVHLLAIASQDPITEEDLPAEDYWKGIHVHRVNPKTLQWTVPLIGLKTRFPYEGLFKSLAWSIWTVDTAWLSLIHHFVDQYQIQALHIHDLRLLRSGLLVGQQFEIPVVADLHENYPALMQMLKGKNNPAKGYRQRRKWEQIEKFTTTQADHVITVAEESRERIIFHGVAPYRVSVVSNTVDVEKFEQAPVDSDVIKRFKSKFLLTYVGHVNAPHRGIHTMLEAMALLKDRIPELFFVAAGGIRDDYFEQLQTIIQSHGLHAMVDFTGWLDEMDFVSYIKASDICVCPHTANEQTNTGMPNKVYLYHLFGKPLVASNCIPLKRYVDETQGGLIFDAENPQDLAEKIYTLYKSQELRKTLGENGRQAVLSTFNWNNAAHKLVDIYRQLFDTTSHSGRRRRVPPMYSTAPLPAHEAHGEREIPQPVGVAGPKAFYQD